MKYGILILRAQPFHNGHKQIVDQIIADGLIPVLFLGSAQEWDTERNPYPYDTRSKLVKLVFPKVRTQPLYDYDCWNVWHNQVVEQITSFTTLNECTIYTFSKPEDLCSFEFRGVTYEDEYYSKVFELDGMAIKHIESADCTVRATNIRNDLEANKHHLHPEVYKYIKEL